jgi:hypothetical protein
VARTLGYIKSQGVRFRVERIPIRELVPGDYLYSGRTLTRVRSVAIRPTSNGTPAVWVGTWDGRYPNPYADYLYVSVAIRDPEREAVDS